MTTKVKNVLRLIKLNSTTDSIDCDDCLVSRNLNYNLNKSSSKVKYFNFFKIQKSGPGKKCSESLRNFNLTIKVFKVRRMSAFKEL